MSHSASQRHISRATVMVRRLLRAPLRLKVMAGVLAVTLVALVAFDVAAVGTVRRNLLNQTDDNLQGALTLTLPRLATLLARQPAGGSAGSDRGARAVRVLPPGIDPGPARRLRDGVRAGSRRAGDPAGRREQRHEDDRLDPLAPHGQDRRPARPTHPDRPERAPHLRVVSLRAPGGSLVAGTSLDQVDETIVQVELIVILGSIAVVLLIGFGVFVVLRRGLRPIETMAAQADRITAGDLTDRVTPHHPGSEVGRLGMALNGMLARIEAGVHEREASQQQMRRFFADASHELRTPLASLRANAELYQQGALRGPDEVDEVMDRIVLETRRMGRLVDDMLRLARLGQHPGQSCEPVDMTAVVAGCAERARIADPARTWQVRISGGLATVGDEELLRRAVDNLLMNVLVHTAAGTAGAISAYQTGGQVIVEVSDDGPGVPPDQLPHIFERFYRGGARSRRPGSGLGPGHRRRDRLRARRHTRTPRRAAQRACGSPCPSRSTAGRPATRTQPAT